MTTYAWYSAEAARVFPQAVVTIRLEGGELVRATYMHSMPELPENVFWNDLVYLGRVVPREAFLPDAGEPALVG